MVIGFSFLFERVCLARDKLGASAHRALGGRLEIPWGFLGFCPSSPAFRRLAAAMQEIWAKTALIFRAVSAKKDSFVPKNGGVNVKPA